MKNNNIVEIPANLLSVFKAINKKQNRYITLCNYIYFFSYNILGDKHE